MPSPTCPLPDATTQLADLRQIVDAGSWPALDGAVEAATAALTGEVLVCVSPPAVLASQLAPLLRHGDQPGFVVEDMTDVDAFRPVELASPPSQVYALLDVRRGDELRGRSPNEAVATLTEAGRTPLTLVEGALWVWRCPQVLQRNHCFMTAGSRLTRPDGRLDSRVPAVWISNGTGRDGSARRGAPKVGWCWANNRHDWLGFASAGARVPLAG